MADSISLENNTITLFKVSPEQYDEGIVSAGETIYPGQAVTLDLTGNTDRDNLLYHRSDGSTSIGIFPERTFAIENVSWGKSITDAYQEGERIMLVHARPGDVILTKVADVSPDTDLYTGSLLSTYTGTYVGWLQVISIATAPSSGNPFPIAVSLEYEATPTLPRWTAVRIM